MNCCHDPPPVLSVARFWGVKAILNLNYPFTEPCGTHAPPPPNSEETLHVAPTWISVQATQGPPALGPLGPG